MEQMEPNQKTIPPLPLELENRSFEVLAYKTPPFDYVDFSAFSAVDVLEDPNS